MTPIVGEILGWEALLVVLIIVVLFGGAKLPKLARSMGQASKEFRKGAADDDEAADTDSTEKPPA